MNKMDPGDFLRRQELVASLPDVIDIGVGDDLVKQTGMESLRLAALMKEGFSNLIDGGASGLLIHLQGGDVRAYAMRRGRMVDVGTRRDFKALGWEVICDMLDNPPIPLAAALRAAALRAAPEEELSDGFW